MHRPTRTVLLPFGFDEESGNRAHFLADHILEKYGEDCIAVIVDEGSKMQKLWGALVAQPGVAEKGNINVHVTVRVVSPILSPLREFAYQRSDLET